MHTPHPGEMRLGRGGDADMVDVKDVFVALETRDRHHSVGQFGIAQISHVIANFMAQFRKSTRQKVMHGTRRYDVAPPGILMTG